ncbi:MAG TPA: hypothetical protein VLT57_03750 [Bryobacteraceae bacterium]|nr:hypothetical protein [Bryobacteraceae bacterium]
MTGNALHLYSRAASRRGFLAAALSAGVVRAEGPCSPARYGTPYKYGKLILAASGQEARMTASPSIARSCSATEVSSI